MHQARGLETSEPGFRIFQSVCTEVEISPGHGWLLHTTQIPYLGCLRVFNDEISSVLQLISRNGCHKLNHGKIAFPLLPDSLLVLLGVLHV